MPGRPPLPEDPPEVPPLPPAVLPPLPPSALPPVPFVVPPEPVLPPVADPPSSTVLMQELKPVQSVMAKQPLSAFSASDRPALVIDCRELFTAFLHWSAVIPERESQPPAFWHTAPAMSVPP